MEWCLLGFDYEERKFKERDILERLFRYEKMSGQDGKDKEHFEVFLKDVVGRRLYNNSIYVWYRDGKLSLLPVGESAVERKRCEFQVAPSEEEFWKKLWDSKPKDKIGIASVTWLDQLRMRWNDFVDYCWENRGDIEIISLSEPLQWYVKVYNRRKDTLIDMNIFPQIEEDARWLAETEDFELFQKRLHSVIRGYFEVDSYKCRLNLIRENGIYFAMPDIGSYDEQLKHIMPLEDQAFWGKVWVITADKYHNVSVCDQLKVQWDEFEQYCWARKHKFPHIYSSYKRYYRILTNP